MTTDQRRRSAAVLAQLEDRTRHSTDLAAHQGAYGITSDPIMSLAELLAFDVEERKAVWRTLDRSTKVAIALERLTERDIFFDSSDVNAFVAGLDAKAEAAAVEAEARALAAAERAAETPLTERTIALAPGGHELDDGDVKAAYWEALRHPEMQRSRWQTALRKAFDHLDTDRFVVSINQRGCYLWWADDDQGGNYPVTPSTCMCTAFVNGDPCRHRAVGIILALLPRG